MQVVLLDGAGERGFCAGGDIRAVYESARSGSNAALQLWREEYVLDAAVAGYSKPVVSVADKITMGAGVGIGCHGAHRVTTQRSLLAMPEVSNGLAPDVGGHLLLARAPGELGTYLALTAARVGPADALLCGLVDYVVHSAELGALAERLQHLDPPRDRAEHAAGRRTRRRPAGGGTEGGSMNVLPVRTPPRSSPGCVTIPTRTPRQRVSASPPCPRLRWR